jgi:hypothetical protein
MTAHQTESLRYTRWLRSRFKWSFLTCSSFLASLFLFVWQSAHLNNEAAHGIESLLFIGRIFVVGPYAVHFALRGPYNGFRLQAYGQRFI